MKAITERITVENRGTTNDNKKNNFRRKTIPNKGVRSNRVRL